MTHPLKSRAARLTPAFRRARSIALAVIAFLSATGFAAAQGALPIFVADFNHDGIPDALVLSTSAPTGTVALGSVPYGTFSANAKGITFPAACTSLYTGTGGAAPIVIADVNNDGFPDIVFRCRTNPQLGADGLAGVMLGNGDGTFAAPVTLPTYISTETVVADFDGDGKLDVVLVGQLASSSYGLLFYKGNGDGTFAAPASLNFGTSSAFNPNFVIESAAAADVNGDGYLDLVTESIFSPGSDPTGAPRILSVFGNNKDGTFGQVASGATVPNTTTTLGNYPDVNAFTVLPANVYDSGKPDFLIPDIGTTPGILAVKNTSTATTYSFATPVRTASPGLTDARPGNFTGTPFSDIAVSSATGVTVLANDGAGNFTAGYSTLSALLPAAGQSVIDPFAVADANSDTYSDIYTASTNASGGLQLNVSLVSGSATATAAPVTLGIGNKDVSAVWPGNVNFAASTATGSQTVQGVPVGVTVLSSKNPANLGDPVTFTISVAPLTASTIIPTGVVTVQQNGTSIGGGTLDSTGVFSLTTTQNVAGSFPIRAAYGGDNFFAGAVSTILTQVVNQAVAAAPTLTWPTPAPIPYGTPLSPTQLDAVATDADGTVIPGTFTYTPAAGTILPGGPQTLSVTFTPNDLASFLTATQTVVLNVLPAASATTLNVSASDSGVTSVSTGTVITLTANVNAAGLGVSPGQVHFCDSSACTGTHLLGTAQLTRSGIAILNFIPGPGTHTYQAVFLGTNSVTQSSATASSTLTVTSAIPTTTTLQQTGTPGNYTLTATTTGVGPIAPTGTTSFLDGSNGNAPLATAVLGSASKTITFATSASPAGGIDTYASATGDLDGDGIQDLVLSNTGSNSLTVLLGNGDGTFRQIVSPAAGPNPGAVVLADFNSDGILDIAVLNGPSGQSEGSLTILIGNGDGTFVRGQGADFVDDEPFGIATADFDNDGIPDLILANVTNELTILHGNGDGSFTSIDDEGEQFDHQTTVATGDFNGDGKTDLVLGRQNTVQLLLGNGDGTFQDGGNGRAPALTISTAPVLPNSIAVADVNGDGKQDIVIADQGDAGTPGELLVLVGNGDGTFTAAPSSAVGNRPDGVVVADFNGDGIPDIATSNIADNTVTVSLGNGNGSFTAISTLTTGPVPTSISVADFNGDGTPDLVTANSALFGSQSFGNGSASVFLTQIAETVTATTTGLSIAPGTHRVVASYPGDSTYASSLSTPTTLSGLQLTTTLNWQPKVTSIPYGSPLGPLELDAVAVSPLGDVVPGTYTYAPQAGTILQPGTQTLGVTFVPADPTVFTGASGNIQILVVGLAPTEIAPNTIPVGAGATTITITGAGFSPTAIVQVNGAQISTSVVSSTTLTAIIPASDFTKTGTLQVVVFDPTINQTSPALTVTVIPASPQVTLSGPSTVIPGTQPTLAFALTNPYPVTLNGDFDLSFAPAVNPPVDDPAVQFATGGRTLSFTVPADSTAVPKVQLQSGTVAGTITVPLLLTANGLNVTPTSIQPVVIVIPAAVPAVSSATMTRSGDQLTVVLHGFSNTREVTQATFHFVGISGAQIDTPDVTVPVGPAFTAWYSSAASDQYGSTFTYTQTFTVGGGAASIDSVQVTLTNSVGASVMQTAQ